MRSKIMGGMLDILFPSHCSICKKSGEILCTSCLQRIQPVPSPFCLHCSTPLEERDACKRCRDQPLRMSGLSAVSLFEEPLRSCIHALKYEGNTRLAEPLGGLLAETYKERRLQADMVIAVPLHAQRQKRRGYNQAQLLAEACAQRIKVPVETSIVSRIRITQAQVQLAFNERQQNVAGAFECHSLEACKRLRGKKILIIDDVCTTGSTLEECAMPLWQAGVSTVWGLVLARAR